MYDSVSHVCIALLVIGYFLILAALTWSALGSRLRCALKSAAGLASARRRKAGHYWVTHWKGREPKTRTLARDRILPLLFALIVARGSGFAQTPNPSGPQPAEALIEGVVTVNDEGQPSAIPGVRVTSTATTPGSETLTTITDAEGRYQFTKLGSGAYTIEVNLEGFKLFAEAVVVKEADISIKNVSLELDKLIQKVEVRDKARGCLHASSGHNGYHQKRAIHYPAPGQAEI